MALRRVKTSGDKNCNFKQNADWKYFQSKHFFRKIAVILRDKFLAQIKLQVSFDGNDFLGPKTF